MEADSGDRGVLEDHFPFKRFWSGSMLIGGRVMETPFPTKTVNSNMNQHCTFAGTREPESTPTLPGLGFRGTPARERRSRLVSWRKT